VSSKRKPGVTPASMKLEPVVASGALPMERSLLTAGIELDPATERERETRMETLKGELGRMLAEGKGNAVIDHVLSLVVKLERENERFAWRLLRELRYRFGRQTEKLSREELAQLFLALGGDEATAKTAEPLEVPAPARPSDAEMQSRRTEASQRESLPSASQAAGSRSHRLSSGM
jgi:hypothetical protein